MLYAARSKHLEGGVAAGEAGEIEAVLQELSPIACAPLIHVIGSKQCRQHNRTTQWPACNIHTMDLSGKCTCSCQRQYFFTVYNKSLNKEGRWRTKKSNARWAKACACVSHTQTGFAKAVLWPIHAVSEADSQPRPRTSETVNGRDAIIITVTPAVKRRPRRTETIGMQTEHMRSTRQSRR